MSRIIVKGLPPQCNEAKLRDFFKKFGTITDCSLKFTKEGKFRRFAFVGFEQNGGGDKAISQSNNTFMGSYRLMVEECKPFGDQTKPRAWSQYAKDSSAFKRKHGEPDDVAVNGKQAREQKATLAADDETAPVKKGNKKLDHEFKEFLEAKGVDVKEDEEVPLLPDPAEEEDYSPLIDELLGGIRGDTSLSLLLTGLPPSIKQKHVKDWFAPVRVKALKVARNEKAAASFVSFDRAPDVRRALLKNNQFLGGYKITVKTVNVPSAEGEHEDDTGKAGEPGVSREEEEAKIRDAILDTGRLFVRNLPYQTKEDDLRVVFKKYGEIAEVQVIVAKATGLCKGFAIVEFMFPEAAVAAYAELDGSIFKGRMMHIVAGAEKRVKEGEGGGDGGEAEGSSFKKDKMQKIKAGAAKSTHSWNALFLGPNAIADTLAEKLGVEKHDLLQETGESTAVRLALAETRLVRETRDFLLGNGVRLDAFSRPATKRSDTVILVKNLPAAVEAAELERLFEKHGEVQKCLIPPEGGVSALVVMGNAVDAKKAFQNLAYARFRTQPLFLEWAPFDVMEGKEGEEAKEEGEEEEEQKQKEKTKKKRRLELSEEEKKEERKSKKHKKKEEPEEEVKEEQMETEEVKEGKEAEKKSKKKEKKEKKKEVEETPVKEEEEEEEEGEGEEKEEEGEEEDKRDIEEGALLFVKNLAFDTTDRNLQRLFADRFDIQSAKVSRKLNPVDPSRPLSMGFGFVQFYTREQAMDAIKTMQGSLLDGHSIELKLSNREMPAEDGKKKRKGVDRLEQGDCTKICVRNLPFQATPRELESLFTTFGQVKSARIPKKVGGKSHRGFGFVDFATKGDAKRAFNALVHSTHLYGRRLVLEWAKTDQEETVQDMRDKTAANFTGEAREQRKLKKRMEAIEKDLKVIDDD